MVITHGLFNFHNDILLMPNMPLAIKCKLDLSTSPGLLESKAFRDNYKGKFFDFTLT